MDGNKSSETVNIIEVKFPLTFSSEAVNLTLTSAPQWTLKEDCLYHSDIVAAHKNSHRTLRKTKSSQPAKHMTWKEAQLPLKKKPSEVLK